MEISTSGDRCSGTIHSQSESLFCLAILRSDLLAPVDPALSPETFLGSFGPFLKPAENCDKLGHGRFRAYPGSSDSR